MKLTWPLSSLFLRSCAPVVVCRNFAAPRGRGSILTRGIQIRSEFSSVSNFFVRYFAKFVRVALIVLAKIRHKRIINLLEFDLATADHPNLNQSDILLPKRQGVIWTRRRKKSDTMTFEIWATLVNTKIVSTSWIWIISSSLVFHLLVKVARHLDIDIRTPRPQRSWYKRNNQRP